ncbi:hypothetical protein BGW42_008744 [Actinomortierella wolfii]|nr:hypothetical protein BGW42_008744 [Actinomortierella wolfii]
MPTPPVHSAYPSPLPELLERMEDEKNTNMPRLFAEPLASTPVDAKDDHTAPLCPTISTSLTLHCSTTSLPSPSSPSLGYYDDDLNDNRFDPDYGSFRVQSPSMNHSHQQHRDLESAFCRNFSCCGLNLRDLHDLLQHYEECHVRFEDDDDDSLSGEDSSSDPLSPSSHLHATAAVPLMFGQQHHHHHHHHHHPPRYHRLTAISDTRSGSLLESMGIGMGIQFGASRGGLYDDDDDDDSWSESDSNPTSRSSSSPSLTSMTVGGSVSPSLAASIQVAHSGSRSLHLPFLTSPHDHSSTSHALELVAGGFGPGLKRKAGVSLSDIYAEDGLDQFRHFQGCDAPFANTRLRPNSSGNCTLTPPSTSSTMEHLSSVALKKQALENSQRVNAAAALLAQSNLHGTTHGNDANGMPPHAPPPQIQHASSQTLPTGFRPSTPNNHPPFPPGHPQHPQTHPLARVHHTMVPSLSGDAPRLPFGTIPSVLMTSTAHRHSVIPGPLQTSLPHHHHHPFPPGMTTAEMLRQRDEAFSLIEDMSRNPGACSQGDKPYRCAVLGCDKAYKNPNGLKYHNQHGHCSSLGMCDTDAPGSKPYVCTFLECGKRYKNLNGLKYHIEHSHPNLTAALRAHQSGLMNNLLLYSPYPNQAAMTIAAALAAVQASPMMMAAANAILTAAANNSVNNANNNNNSNNNGNSVGGSDPRNAPNNNTSSTSNGSSGPPLTPVSTTAPAAPLVSTAPPPLPPPTLTTTPATADNNRCSSSTGGGQSVLSTSIPNLPIPTVGPPPPLPLSSVGGPSASGLNQMLPTIQVSSSAPTSAIPPMQLTPPPLCRTANPITDNAVLTESTEDMIIDIDGDTASVSGTGSSGGSGKNTNGNNHNHPINKHGLVEHKNDHRSKAKENSSSSSVHGKTLTDISTTNRTEEGKPLPPSTVASEPATNKKSRGKQHNATAAMSPNSSSTTTTATATTALTTTAEASSVASNDKDRRKVVHKQEHPTTKKGDNMISSATAASVPNTTSDDHHKAPATSSSISSTLACKTKVTAVTGNDSAVSTGTKGGSKMNKAAVGHDGHHKEEEASNKAATALSQKVDGGVHLATRSNSDPKSPVLPTPMSTTTMVTRSNKHHQPQQQQHVDEDKKPLPPPLTTRRMRK